MDRRSERARTLRHRQSRLLGEAENISLSDSLNAGARRPKRQTLPANMDLSESMKGRRVMPGDLATVTVQENVYRDEPFDAAFEDYEQLRDSVDQRPDEDQRDVETYGVTRPYGWAEDRTRQYATPRRTDWGTRVRNQGFGLE